MKTRTLDVRGTSVELLEAGEGPPVLYLHGVYDVHTLQGRPFPFHDELAKQRKLLMPALPGCGESTGVADIMHVEDLAFHYLDMLDALQIKEATIIGFCLGGWIAAEMAVRNPERVGRLVMIGAGGLQVKGALNADLFMYSQNRDGGIMLELRELLFGNPKSEIANALVPDGRVSVGDEVRRYKGLTTAGRVGWEPPYFLDQKLQKRLHRITAPTLLLWGEQDRLIPLANGKAYKAGIAKATLQTIKSAGHSVHIEKPDECLAHIVSFLEKGALPKAEARAKIQVA
jgi:pimeloyl-ACP methyl ester carboxylesterase